MGLIVYLAIRTHLAKDCCCWSSHGKIQWIPISAKTHSVALVATGLGHLMYQISHHAGHLNPQHNPNDLKTTTYTRCAVQFWQFRSIIPRYFTAAPKARIWLPYFIWTGRRLFPIYTVTECHVWKSCDTLTLSCLLFVHSHIYAIFFCFADWKALSPQWSGTPGLASISRSCFKQTFTFSRISRSFSLQVNNSETAKGIFHLIDRWETSTELDFV